MNNDTIVHFSLENTFKSKLKMYINNNNDFFNCGNYLI